MRNPQIQHPKRTWWLNRFPLFVTMAALDEEVTALYLNMPLLFLDLRPDLLYQQLLLNVVPVFRAAEECS